MRTVAIVSLLLTLLAHGPVYGQPADTRPVAPTGELRATVSSIQGSAQVRESETAAWKPAQVGMVVPQGAEFRTGPRSSLTFTIPPQQTITIDRLTTVKVVQAVADQNQVSTDIGMRYGRTMYEVESAGIRHDSRIISPSATMAVRGTRVVYDDHAPFPPALTSLEGRVQYRNLRKQAVAFGGRQRTRMSATDTAPGETARRETRVDPQGASSGKTDAENEQIAANTAVAGLDASGVLAITSELRRQFNIGLQGTAVGTTILHDLDIFLSWRSPKGTGSVGDLDLSVIDPNGRTIDFRNPTINTGGAVGSHSGNDRGGTGFRVERVELNQFPPGAYRVQVQHAGGSPARTFVNVNVDGLTRVAIGQKPKPIILRQGQSLSRTITVK